jgi:hypothetical protein
MSKEKSQYKASFKIKDKLTGLYRLGNNWSKTGKSWSNIGHLKSHLKIYFKDFSKIPINWEIVVMLEIPNTYIPASGIDCLKVEQIISTAIGQANLSSKLTEK